MNLIAKGREIGLTASQVREIIKEQRELAEKEKRMKEVLGCDNMEDLKILLMHWIEQGYVK
jgi:hypothetical protein